MTCCSPVYVDRILKKHLVEIPMKQLVSWIYVTHHWPYHLAWLTLVVEELNVEPSAHAEQGEASSLLQRRRASILLLQHAPRLSSLLPMVRIQITVFFFVMKTPRLNPIIGCPFKIQQNDICIKDLLMLVLNIGYHLLSDMSLVLVVLVLPKLS